MQNRTGTVLSSFVLIFLLIIYPPAFAESPPGKEVRAHHIGGRPVPFRVNGRWVVLEIDEGDLRRPDKEIVDHRVLPLPDILAIRRKTANCTRGAKKGAGKAPG